MTARRTRPTHASIPAAYPDDGRSIPRILPDIVVLRRSGGGQATMPISEAVLLGEIVSSGNGRKDLIDRPREYAAAGVPFFLRIEFRNRLPGLVLHELIDGGYQPVSAAAAGRKFAMKEPFEFAVDPADLLDEEG